MTCQLHRHLHSRVIRISPKVKRLNQIRVPARQGSALLYMGCVSQPHPKAHIEAGLHHHSPLTQ